MDADGLRAWVEGVRREGRCVMHRATGRFGAVVRYHDGVESRHRSAVDGSECDGPVVELTTGDAFLVPSDDGGLYPDLVFRVLSDRETVFYRTATAGVAAVVGELAKAGASFGVSEDLGPELIADVLRRQATALVGPPRGEG